MERTPLSDRELRRGEVISRVISGELTSVDASELLDLSTRQVKRLTKRYRSGRRARAPAPEFWKAL